MEIAYARDVLHVRDSDLAESRFSGTKLPAVQFTDVNMRGAVFSDVSLVGAQISDANLDGASIEGSKWKNAQLKNMSLEGLVVNDVNFTGARLVDVNLTGMSIDDANLTGMTINGLSVTDLIRASKKRARMVLYAKNLAALRTFYCGVFNLRTEESEQDHVVLGSPAYQLVIVQTPASVAATIHIADPPVRRGETPIKLSLEVENISEARSIVSSLGGAIDPAEREWIFQAERVCDGHDPEGNVLQFRQMELKTSGG